jgi:hypothetical protein
MKKLLLAAAIAMIVISPALAGGDSDFDRCKGCPSWRDASSLRLSAKEPEDEISNTRDCIRARRHGDAAAVRASTAGAGGRDHRLRR